MVFILICYNYVMITCSKHMLLIIYDDLTHGLKGDNRVIWFYFIVKYVICKKGHFEWSFIVKYVMINVWVKFVMIMCKRRNICVEMIIINCIHHSLMLDDIIWHFMMWTDHMSCLWIIVHQFEIRFRSVISDSNLSAWT